MVEPALSCDGLSWSCRRQRGRWLPRNRATFSGYGARDVV